MSSFHLAYPLFIFNILLFSAFLPHSQTTHPHRFANLLLTLFLARPKGFTLHSELLGILQGCALTIQSPPYYSDYQ